MTDRHHSIVSPRMKIGISVICGLTVCVQSAVGHIAVTVGADLRDTKLDVVRRAILLAGSRDRLRNASTLRRGI